MVSRFNKTEGKACSFENCNGSEYLASAMDGWYMYTVIGITLRQKFAFFTGVSLQAFILLTLRGSDTDGRR